MNNVLEEIKGKSILVTGACGLVGSAFIDYCMVLNVKHSFDIHITAMCRNKDIARKRFFSYKDSEYFHIYEEDVCNGLKSEGKWNYIIHTASNSHPIAFSKEPVETMKANLLGTINILDYIVQQKEKGFMCSLVYISSGEVYGEAECGINGFEESQIGIVDSLKVRSCYPESKRAAETLCVSYANEYKIQAKIARLGYVYGPGFDDKNSRADIQFFRKAINQENIVLRSKGDQIRSYCYITDAISGLFYILLKGQNANAYNIANKESIITIKGLAEKIAKVSGVNVIYDIPPQDENNGYSKMKKEVLCVEKLESLGWRAKVQIDEGIKNVISYNKEISDTLFHFDILF